MEGLAGRRKFLDGDGDEAVLVGRQGPDAISIGEFSRWADTIPWETLCSVTKRVPRIYKTALGT